MYVDVHIASKNPPFNFHPRLSALLAEATSTSDSIYLAAALDSAAFIRAHLSNNSNSNNVQQTMSARQNDSCAILDDTTNSFNSGLFVEGLAVLVAITRNGSTQALSVPFQFSPVSNYWGWVAELT